MRRRGFTPQRLNDMIQITSRFDGVIKKLHYEAEDTAQVGKVFLPIRRSLEPVLKITSLSATLTS